MSELLTITVGNVHCSDCEATIRRTLSRHVKITDSGETDGEKVSKGNENKPQYTLKIKDGVISVENTAHPASHELRSAVKSIVEGLRRDGFLVYSWNLDHDGEVAVSSENKLAATDDANAFESHISWYDLWRSYKRKQQIKHHFKNCATCQEQRRKDKESHSDSADSEHGTLVQSENQEFRAVFSISGMSCASCVLSVSESISTLLRDNGIEEKLEEPQFSVNLLQHSAVVLVPNKQIVNKIANAIEDAGFSAQLVELLPILRSVNQKVTAIIGGITCAACVNSVVSAVNELPFVLDSGVNAVTKVGQFVLEKSSDGSNKNLELLKNTVEDCGFDFELVKDEKINFTSGKQTSRTINIAVEGMFCNNCPSTIMSYLETFGVAVTISDPITLDQPFVAFSYVPNVEKQITVRMFIHDLNHLFPLENAAGFIVDDARDGPFKCHIVEKVSVDEHVRALSKKETMRIVRRLVIAVVLAIPSFVFGVVGMSLVPTSNHFRMWLDEPILAGNASRVTWILFFLSTPAYFFAADIFHVKAMKEIRSLWIHKSTFKKRFLKFGSMNLLMFLGTTIAYVASIVLLALSSRQSAMSMGAHTTYFDSVVFLTLFLLIGRLLESLSKSKTADAVSSLSSMKATTATVTDRVIDAKTEETLRFDNDLLVDVKLLDSGDYIRIGSGESPPVDCVVVEGTTEFDESALTGESHPVTHKPGQQIFSGTVNIGSTSIIAKILSVEGDSLIDQIVSTVRDGQMRKAPIQRLADQLTGYFVPVIVLMAILTWVVWLALAYSGVLPDSYLDIDIGGWTVWSLEFSIAVFVIACPCGIGLAAPTALFVGSGLAAKYGILARGGGAAFQDAATANLVCFDKTGTLTRGQMQVTDVAFVENSNVSAELELVSMQIVRDIELASNHPVATAIKEFVKVDYKQKDKISSSKVPLPDSISGKGLTGQIVLNEGDDSFWSLFASANAILGNEALLHDYEVRITSRQQDLLDKWKLERKSVVALAIKSPKAFGNEQYHLTALIACRDEIRAESEQVIKFLQSQNIECWMITGDNKLTAEAIGAQLGIGKDRIISEVLPNEKQEQVKLLRSKERIVAMVGDGINDAPALAAADVGIALCSGADIALSSSDFILLSKTHPLITLCTLFDLAAVVFRRVKFNFAWSLIYNAIGLPIAAGVIYPYKNLRLNPVWASAAMAASSVSVVTSSLLLRLYRPKVRARDLAKSVTEEKEDVKVERI